MKTAELKVLPVSALRPAEYNPRKKLKPGDKEYQKIKASIVWPLSSPKPLTGSCPSSARTCKCERCLCPP